MSQLERVVYIDRALRERGPVTARSVATRFEISRRQAKRDVEYMRDRLGAPIVFDAHKRSYAYEVPYEDLRFADERMLLFYVVVRSLATNEAYVPVLSAEVVRELESHVAQGYRCLEERIRYDLSLSEPIDMDLFSGLCEAMRDGKCVDISYVNSEAVESVRRIEPERLVHYSGKWYVVAYDQLRSSLRTFHTARIQRFSLSRDSVTKQSTRSGDDLDEYIEQSFGMFKGEQIGRAVVRFHGKVVPLVRNQRWHPEQVDAEGSDGKGEPWLDRSLPVAETSELLSRVLSFGSHAEALAPEAFRSRWSEEIARMAERAKG